MAIDLKNLLSIVQKKINNLDSSTSTLQELLDVANFTDKASSGTILFVDDSSDLPNLNDVTLPTADGARSLVFAKNSGRLFAKKDTWKPFTFRGLIPSSGSSSSPAQQGSTSGYSSGGSTPSTTNVIDKFPFASDANATDVADMTASKTGTAGQSSSVSGYNSGGLFPGTTNVIEKFAFATDGNGTDVGDLTSGRYHAAGQTSPVSGYTSGGALWPYTNIIDKFPFASDGNATDVGDVTVARFDVAGQSSADNGYSSGGRGASDYNIIDKFPFSSDANATDVGDLSASIGPGGGGAGQNSVDNGYITGEISPYAGFLQYIDKFPFSSDANASNIGTLTVARKGGGGVSSTASGYTFGGISNSNIIDKFPFASDGNATDVGDLTTGRYRPEGQQV